MAHKAPGKSDREGITMMQLCDMFPTEESARKWFEPAYGQTGSIARNVVALAPMRRAITTCPIGAPIAGATSRSRPGLSCTCRAFHSASGFLRSTCT